MGLLDDAIREHLELKRQRGADPGEVSRQEREALGDPRSGAAPELADDAAPPVALPDEPAAAAAPAPEVGPEPPAPVPAPEPEAEVAPAPAPEPEPEPAAYEPPPPPAPAPPREQAREPEPGEQRDEDVLEETPDFLQETPEHDRLWFEQRPPRDFDF